MAAGARNLTSRSEKGRPAFLASSSSPPPRFPRMTRPAIPALDALPGEEGTKNLKRPARCMEGSDHEKPSALAVIVPNGYGRAGNQDVGVIPVGALGP